MMRSSALQKLVQLDMFGYPISLYYHEKKKDKASLCGLVVTVILLTLASIYAGTLARNVGNTDYQHVI